MNRWRAARRVGWATMAAAAVIMFSGCSLLPGSSATRDSDTGDVVEGGQESVFEVHVGDCFDDEGVGEEVYGLPLVPCDQPHDNEIIALFDLPDGDYPGEEAARTAADDGCRELFEGYVGIAYDDSSLELFDLTPSAGSWENGDREVICAVWDPSGPLTGSVKDSGL